MDYTVAPTGKINVNNADISLRGQVFQGANDPRMLRGEANFNDFSITWTKDTAFESSSLDNQAGAHGNYNSTARSYINGSIDTSDATIALGGSLGWLFQAEDTLQDLQLRRMWADIYVNGLIGVQLPSRSRELGNRPYTIRMRIPQGTGGFTTPVNVFHLDVDYSQMAANRGIDVLSLNNTIPFIQVSCTHRDDVTRYVRHKPLIWNCFGWNPKFANAADGTQASDILLKKPSGIVAALEMPYTRAEILSSTGVQQTGTTELPDLTTIPATGILVHQNTEATIASEGNTQGTFTTGQTVNFFSYDFGDKTANWQTTTVDNRPFQTTSDEVDHYRHLYRSRISSTAGQVITVSVGLPAKASSVSLINSITIGASEFDVTSAAISGGNNEIITLTVVGNISSVSDGAVIQMDEKTQLLGPDAIAYRSEDVTSLVLDSNLNGLLETDAHKLNEDRSNTDLDNAYAMLKAYFYNNQLEVSGVPYIATSIDGGTLVADLDISVVKDGETLYDTVGDIQIGVATILNSGSSIDTLSSGANLSVNGDVVVNDVNFVAPSIIQNGTFNNANMTATSDISIKGNVSGTVTDGITDTNVVAPSVDYADSTLTLDGISVVSPSITNAGGVTHTETVVSTGGGLTTGSYTRGSLTTGGDTTVTTIDGATFNVTGDLDATTVTDGDLTVSGDAVATGVIGTTINVTGKLTTTSIVDSTGTVGSDLTSPTIDGSTITADSLTATTSVTGGSVVSVDNGFTVGILNGSTINTSGGTGSISGTSTSAIVNSTSTAEHNLNVNAICQSCEFTGSNLDVNINGGGFNSGSIGTAANPVHDCDFASGVNLVNGTDIFSTNSVNLPDVVNAAFVKTTQTGSSITQGSSGSIVNSELDTHVLTLGGDATNSVLNGNDSISVQNVTGGTMSGVAITTTGASGVTAASNTYTSTGDWNNGTLTVGNSATLINFLGNTASLTSGGNVSVSDAQTGFITMNGANGTSTITTLTGSNVEQVASHTTNITNANGGEVHGGTVNMLGQMNGVTFDSTDVAMTIENVQTNLATAPQDATFLGSDIDVELPNPGIVTFTTSSSTEGPIRFTRGPADTQETLTGTGNSWTAVGTSDTRSVNDLITISGWWCYII